MLPVLLSTFASTGFFNLTSTTGNFLDITFYHVDFAFLSLESLLDLSSVSTRRLRLFLDLSALLLDSRDFRVSFFLLSAKSGLMTFCTDAVSDGSSKLAFAFFFLFLLHISHFQLFISCHRVAIKLYIWHIIFALPVWIGEATFHFCVAKMILHGLSLHSIASFSNSLAAPPALLQQP